MGENIKQPHAVISRSPKQVFPVAPVFPVVKNSFPAIMTCVRY